MQILIGLLAVVGAALVAGWLGLRVQPRPFPPYPEPTPPLRTVPLPPDLPPPVARFYRTIIGDQIPVIESAVLTLSGQLRFAGITFPARLRFTHDAGKGYRHYIEATVFGFPLLKVNEWYLDGRSRLELPVGVVENDPKVNQGANLGVWGESIWLPSIFITDPRARWEPLDDHHARLVVPFGEEEESFTATFDPQSGLLTRMEAMRWKGAESKEKTRWILEVRGWETAHGIRIPSPAAVTWADEGTPWLVVRADDVAYNVDVTAYIRARGL